MRFFLILFLSFSGPIFASQWEYVRDSEGIKVFKKEAEGQDLFIVKGIGKTDASIGKILAVLRDFKRAPEWADRLIEVRSLEKKSEFDQVVYSRSSMPWPLLDREFIYQTKITYDLKRESIAIRMKSISYPDSPKIHGILGIMHQSHIVISKINENRSLVEVSIQIDPKGSIPVWVVNMFQKNWPINTLRGLRKQTAKKDVFEFPIKEEWLRYQSNLKSKISSIESEK